MKYYVLVSFQFEGFHSWPQAPDEVAFLRDRHRHIFHVRAKKRVQHEDRDVEFILLKRELERCAQRLSPSTLVQYWSCETWATHFVRTYDLAECEVWEDKENGALVVAQND